MAVRCTVQKSRPSWNLGLKVKGQSHQGQTKRKSVAFCSGVVLWGAVLIVSHFFQQRSLRARLRRWENQRMLSSSALYAFFCSVPKAVFGYWTTRGYTNSRTANSRTGQLADATGDFACLVLVLIVVSARPRVVQSAS